jgi:hypothetical protein
METPRLEPHVTIRSGMELFADDAKNFTVRKDDEMQPEAPARPAKDWQQIAFNFLGSPTDMEPLAEFETFEMINITQADQFVAGNGLHAWNTIRRAAIDAAKKKARRYRR